MVMFYAYAFQVLKFVNTNFQLLLLFDIEIIFSSSSKESITWNHLLKYVIIWNVSIF